MSAPAREILVNGERRKTSAATVADLACELSRAPERLLIEHNGRALLRSEWKTTHVRPGDRFEILCVAAGG